MKNRIRKTVNFLAFNLLFFGLYLNFIHQDKQVIPGVSPNAEQAAAFSGAVLVKNPQKYNVETPAPNNTPVSE